MFWLYHIFHGESELYLTLAVLAVGLVGSPYIVRVSKDLRRPFLWLARRRGLAVLSTGLLVLVLRAALLPIFPPPVPIIQDEAAYLLAADTFASGRVANPSHPMWVHLESVHVNHTPTYGSKYPVAQGLTMAFGQVLGHPWIGVWLSAGVMCGLLCWMLQGWLPPGWALFGALLAAARLGVNSYWMNSYWGGAVAAIGGALIFGAYPRLRKKATWPMALAMGLGLAILANSRPYEGVICAASVALAVAAWFWRDHRRSPSRWLRTFALPVVLVLACTGAAMAYYNWRTTADPAKFPYMVHKEKYSVGALFVWQGPSDIPEYRHELHRALYIDYPMEMLEKIKDLKAYLYQRTLQHMQQWNFYLGPLFTLPLITLPWLITDRRIRLPVISLATLMFFVSITISFQAHYWAPIAGVIWVIVIQSMRHLRSARWGRLPIGRSIVAVIPMATVAALIWCHVERARATPWNTVPRYTVRCKMPDEIHPMYQREVVKRKLEAAPGRHLVVVRYAPGHYAHFDWVFNRADIDASKIVWAYDMGADRNDELIEYFSDRTVWLAEPDIEPYRLSSYHP